jgi:hypothetical protein
VNTSLGCLSDFQKVTALSLCVPSIRSSATSTLQGIDNHFVNASDLFVDVATGDALCTRGLHGAISQVGYYQHWITDRRLRAGKQDLDEVHGDCSLKSGQIPKNDAFPCLVGAARPSRAGETVGERFAPPA